MRVVILRGSVKGAIDATGGAALPELPQVQFVPTGGISLDNAGDYIRAGAVAIGIGADLVDTKAIRAGNVHIVTEQARRYLAAVKTARSQKN